MTSKSCTKSYNRKVNNSISSCNIQFDKIFQDHSNRPSAAKSAGTVGKWGITSFTSIRSSKVNGGRGSDNTKNSNKTGIKRSKLDCTDTKKLEQNIFVLNHEEDWQSDINKPKKFFKSRVMPDVKSSKTNFKESQNISNSFLKQSEDNTQSHEYRSDDLNKLSNNSELSLNEFCRDEEKPPIVLRICKGTARFVNSEEITPDIHSIPLFSPLSKIENKKKIESENSKSNVKVQRAICRSSTTSSTATRQLSKTDMRTTRSRAKNFSSDSGLSTLSSTQPDLSMTFRKSCTDPTSHYDIVKSEKLLANYCNTLSETLIENEKLNISTVSSTQELIEILSSNEENEYKISRNRLSIEENQDISQRNEPYHLKHQDISTMDIKNSRLISIESTAAHKTKINSELAQSEKFASSDKAIFMTSEKKTSKMNEKIDDNEYLSSSDDSESTSCNTQGELHESHKILQSELAATTKNQNNSKPVSIKKGSIFKTRSTGMVNSNKRRALYKHKWCDGDRESKIVNTDKLKIDESEVSGSQLLNLNPITLDEEVKNSTLTKIVTYPDSGIDLNDVTESAITSVRCGKKVKEFYTVVKNVKKAHQIQESGEFQEFNDDVEYILDTLRDNNPNATRCLSAIRLASKCMIPAFRMHVRAHGTVAKFFKALHDATVDQSLALCTATVMFVLSQDRLAMDLDRDCLELMLNLLESDASHKNALDDCGLSYTELLKNKEKVRQLCADIQSQGHAKQLNLDNITVGQLAMETLLSLTSKRAGEWFKEELRELGGLEHIIRTITDCHRYISSPDVFKIKWNDSLLDKLRKVDRCLRVLENVTHMNEENQVYLLKYNNSILVITLSNLYKLCGQEIVKFPTKDCSDKTSCGVVLRECLFAILKVLINLTHRFSGNSFGELTVGCQDGVIDNSLHLILRVPDALPEEKRFDMMMLALILLINLVEQCENNKKLLINSKSLLFRKEHQNSLDALICLFYEQEELARAEEQKTDAILDGKKDSEQTEIPTTSKSQEEFIEETVAKLLQKAGRHMEHTLIGAYVVLLLGYLMMDNQACEILVKNKLPDGTFVTMVTILQKFFNFMNLTASNEISSCGIAATEKVIKFLKTSDDRIMEERTNLQESELECANISRITSA